MRAELLAEPRGMEILQFLCGGVADAIGGPSHLQVLHRLCRIIDSALNLPDQLADASLRVIGVSLHESLHFFGLQNLHRPRYFDASDCLGG